MANSVHNAVLKTLQDMGMLSFVGPAYQQASQMVFSPTGSATEAYEQQCLLSYSINRSGEVIKKYDFPTLPPYDETHKEDRMVI